MFVLFFVFRIVFFAGENIFKLFLVLNRELLVLNSLSVHLSLNK